MKKAWVFLVCLLILSACGDDNQNSNTANEGNGGEPVNVQPDQSGVTAEHLKASLVERKQENDTYQFEYAVENKSDKTIHLTFNSGQKFDYILLNEAGDIIEQGSEGKFFTQALVEQDLKPGERLTFEIPLKDLPPGSYTLEAWLTAGSEKTDYKQLLKFTIE
ncbi:BsuPI-related putative proteinase inhibitor [Bacillus sp. FJAT-27916]|uniref:BsuPI-related putative proteinase inhibitor n=1 Tax=Bacillus sp. FJAT-27916 TaxID=1679169 RepID=UPI000670F4E2|nr:BsuPI-related putative proteinase inhibitor [Bacillus sp. FJAT-27916]